MKRICFVTTVSMTLHAFVIPAAKYLHEAGGYDITFICDEDEAFAKELPEFIHFQPVSMKRGISFGGILSTWKLCRIFRKERFDLVQYSTPNASLYASLAAWLARVPNRLYCQWGIAYVGFSGLKRKIFKFVEKIVCCLSTKIEPDSFGNLSFSMEEGLYSEKKCAVIHHGSACGVDLQKFDHSQKTRYREEMRTSLGLGNDSFSFIFVGRITGDKGINELFSAFQAHLTDHPDSRLLLVGNPEKSASVDEALFQWALSCENVIFCGFTNNVEQYLAAADAYILPSYREGFGSATIEAEAMGLPVIVTDISGPTEAMEEGKTGLVVPVKDAKALCEAMNCLSENAELCELFGENGKKMVADKFDQKILLEKILEDRSQILSDRILV